MSEGKVVAIYIASKATSPPIPLKEVRASAGRGLEGDRYFNKIGTYSTKPGPDREITFIELEAIGAMKRDYGIELEPGQTRRNIVTRDAALNHLVGREFVVGEVKFRGIRLCEPCSHLEKLTKPGVESALVHRGGLRAQILSDGIVRVGDVLRDLDSKVQA
jgi:MOSC domain-containing protein YiiM